MKLNSDQVSNFDRDGFLIFRSLFSKREINILREEANRISNIEAECVIREGQSRAPKLLLRIHETDGPTGSAIYCAASRLPRVLGASKQVLREGGN